MSAAVGGTWRNRTVVVHFSTRHDDGTWTIELRRPDRTGPILEAAPGEVVRLERGEVLLVQPVDPGNGRLWRARVDVSGGLRRYLRRHGRPIRYAYVPGEWGLERYQTRFANLRRWPGSAEMPSAARPFTHRLVDRLRHAGIGIASIELHTGVSSQEAHEAPQPERFLVAPQTADAVNRTRSAGHRVVAVGTTVTRALETVADTVGSISPGSGWTELVLNGERPSRVVDGLITGWHPPEASHLRLLEAVAGAELVAEAYEAALAGRYLWHEFGDSCLLLPEPFSS
jgi:S-adenosylmethionine:tRNA ribosyltransferase-isomerase